MNLKKLRVIASKAVKDGPVALHDQEGNMYLGYVMFIREGMKYCLCTIDKDIADLNGPTIEFMVAEATACLEDIGLAP